MSALGQKQTPQHVRVMSALPPIADITESDWDVRFVPKADIEELGAYKKSGEPRGNRDSSRPLQNCPKSVMHWPRRFS